MSKLLDMISKGYLPIKSRISKEVYEQNKNDLPEDEFNRRFLSQQYDEDFASQYYEMTNAFEDQSEFMAYMLHELLEQQKIATRKLKIISGIVVFWLICDLVATAIVLMLLL